MKAVLSLDVKSQNLPMSWCNGFLFKEKSLMLFLWCLGNLRGWGVSGSAQQMRTNCFCLKILTASWTQELDICLTVLHGLLTLCLSLIRGFFRQLCNEEPRLLLPVFWRSLLQGNKQNNNVLWLDLVRNGTNDYQEYLHQGCSLCPLPAPAQIPTPFPTFCECKFSRLKQKKGKQTYS